METVEKNNETHCETVSETHSEWGRWHDWVNDEEMIDIVEVLSALYFEVKNAEALGERVDYRMRVRGWMMALDVCGGWRKVRGFLESEKR